MITAVDTNVLLDILLPDERFHELSEASLEQASSDGLLVICDIVYGELCAHFATQREIDVFLENGYTKEEMKMVHETKKIMGADSIQVTATCVRIATVGGHSESVNIEFENDFDLAEIREILSKTPGVVVKDDVANFVYPMPLTAHEKDETFVGRIRRDETQANTLNCWIVSDNLRKGAATNAVQIAEYLMSKGLLN